MGVTEAKTVVYRARNLVNGKSYIGYTGRGLRQRERQHRHTANGANQANAYLLHRALKKHGQENFVFEVMYDFEGDEDLAKLYEVEAIAKYRPEYNLSYGGEGGALSESSRKKIGDANRGRKMPPSHGIKRRAFLTGRKHTVETKAKMSSVQKGHPGYTKGVPLTEETRSKISAANKGQIPWSAGKKHSAETRAKMSAWQIGRVLPNETRQKMAKARRQLSKTPSDSMRAAWASNMQAAANARKLAVQCVDDGKVFQGSADADRFYGFRIGTVSRVVKGTIKNRTGRMFVRYEGGV